jgi:hypothetical protein
VEHFEKFASLLMLLVPLAQSSTGALPHFAILFKRNNEDLIQVRDASPFFFGPATLAVVFKDKDRYQINLEFYQARGTKSPFHRVGLHIQKICFTALSRCCSNI